MAQFLTAADAEAYAAWRNGDAPTQPQPKFKVGDRLVPSDGIGEPRIVTGIRTPEWRYSLSGDGDEWDETELELAPPEPRAVVTKIIGSQTWVVLTVPPNDRCFTTEEEAAYIAAGLNSHPDWTL